MAGASDYLVIAHVRLAMPVDDGEDPESAPLLGYFRIFGLLVCENQLRASLEAAVDDGTVDWAETEIRLIERSELDPDIQARIQAPDSSGVWYTSGRNFYADDSDEEPN